jgi:hypothetical protein
MTKIIRYARLCSITGNGMNEGWYWQNDFFYTSTEQITIDEIYKREWYPESTYSNLLINAYEDMELYYTGWTEDDIKEQGFYYTKDGICNKI